MAWAVPVAIAGAVVAAAVVNNGSASGATPNLPSRTAAQLIAAALGSSDTTLSGTIQESANLGLPSLPGGHSSASLSWQTFVSGTHSARVWVDGPDKQRVALLGELSEADVVHNGADLWTYTSDTHTVTHSTIAKDKPAAEVPSAADATPAALAARALKAIQPGTAVSVESSQMVANRAAYTLVLRPRDAGSTVQKVTIAIDAAKFVPLQVAVYGSGSAPAFRTGFTKISFSTPSAAIFDFHPPAGATVSQDPFGLSGTHGEGHGRSHAGRPDSSVRGGSAAPKVLGQDWTSVVEVPAGSKGIDAALGGNTLRDLTSPVGNSGARLLHTALLNAVILPDGRAFIGAVQPAALEHLAATTPN